MNVLKKLNTIEGWFSFSEGFLLYTLAKNAKGKGEIVEIGSWKGKSTAFLTQGVKDARKKMKVIAIDPHEGILFADKKKKKEPPTFIEFKNNLKKYNLLSYVRPFVATSSKAHKNWHKKIKVLFIDGLHDYKNTYADFSLWFPFVTNGGVVAFHDAFCGHVGPEQLVLKDILYKDLYCDIGVVGSIVYMQKGKAKGVLQTLNKIRHQLLLPLAARLNKSSLPSSIRFFLIHRVIKFLLINKYTYSLFLNK